EALLVDAALASARLGDDLFDRDPHGVQRLEVGPERVEVPALVVARGRVSGDDLRQRVLAEVLHTLGDVVAFEDHATVGVDGQALAVENVIVLEHVLARLGVARLDLGLGVLDEARDHASGQNLRVVVVGARKQAVGHRRAEAHHELVLEREVETALSRVALTTGTSAQLVVDATRFVAFGSEDVKAADLADLVALLFARLLRLGEDLVPAGLVLLGVLDGVEAARLHLGDGEELGVAAEHDVGTATGHVRCDGDGPEATGDGDDVGLASVVLRVEDLVLDARLRECLRQALALLDAHRAD